jgi:hypothetical protein
MVPLGTTFEWRTDRFVPLAACGFAVLPVVQTTPASAAMKFATPSEALNQFYSPTTAKNKELYGTRGGPLVADQVSYKRLLQWAQAGCPAPVRILGCTVALILCCRLQSEPRG